MDAATYRWVNRFADHTTWLHPGVKAVAVYGIVVFAVLLLVGWWQARAKDDPAAVVAVVWAALASIVAFVAVQVIGNLVQRERPYAVMANVHVLVSRSTDHSFPSDHATAAGAIACGLVLAARRGAPQRWVAVTAVVTAIVLAFARVYVGAHYPGDVIAGLALGAGIAALGAPVAQRVLTPLARRLTTTPLAVLIVAESPALDGTRPA